MIHVEGSFIQNSHTAFSLHAVSMGQLPLSPRAQTHKYLTRYTQLWFELTSSLLFGPG